MNKFYQRGFTLIELLVVIAIIGLLSSIVLASLATARSKARDAQRVSDIRQLRIALQLYYEDNNQTYPASLASLASPKVYISRIPIDPSGSSNVCAGPYYYCYAYLTNPATYHLGAQLENQNPVLSTDKDCNSSTGLAGGGACTTGQIYSPAGSGFDGRDTTYLMYDLVPQ